jgi:hypothetical protein
MLGNDVWTFRTEALVRSVILYNPSGCSAAANGLQSLPDLLGDTQATADAPRMYVAEKITVVAGQGLQIIEESIAADVRRLDEIASEVTAPHQVADINSLLHVSMASLRREQR